MDAGLAISELMDEPTLGANRTLSYASRGSYRRNATLPRVVGNRKLDAFRSKLNASRQDFVEAMRRQINAPARSRAQENFITLHTRRIDTPGTPHHSSDVSGILGRLAASRRMSKSMVSSPILRLSRLFSSSRRLVFLLASTKCVLSPSRRRARQSSTSATLMPWPRPAGSATVSHVTARNPAPRRCVIVMRPPS
jgi:hypothetical protein